MSFVANVREKTCICINFLVGCKRDNCTYAHSKEEIKPCFCKFGLKCKNQSCEFWHPNDGTPSGSVLWEYGIEKMLEYKKEGEKISITKNLINGFDPKSEKDIDDMFTNEFKLKPPHSPISPPSPKEKFIIDPNESEDDEDDQAELGEEVPRVEYNSAELDDINSEVTSDTIDQLLAREQDTKKQRKEDEKTIAEKIKEMNIDDSYASKFAVRKVKLNLNVTNIQYQKIIEFITSQGIRHEILSID